MASKKEFIDAVDAQTASLQTAVDAIDREVKSNTEGIDALTKKRLEAIDAHVTALLPDLRPESFLKLATVLPGAATVEEAERQLREKEELHQGKLAKLLAGFNPNTAEREQALLQKDIDQEQGILDGYVAALERLNKIPKLAVLIEDGYGTDEYEPRWWKNLFTYLADWKAADEAVEAAKQPDWGTLRRKYGETSQNIRLMGSSVGALKTALKKSENDAAEHGALTKAIAAAPQAVLDRLRVQIKARIDGLEASHFADVAACDRRIKALQEKNDVLQQRREPLSEQLTGLLKMRDHASRSSARTIPDQYVQALRNNARAPDRRPAPSYYGGPGVVHVHHDDGPSLLQTVLFMEMIDHFEHPGHGNGHAHEGGFHASDGYHNAFHDTTGQS